MPEPQAYYAALKSRYKVTINDAALVGGEPSNERRCD